MSVTTIPSRLYPAGATGFGPITLATGTSIFVQILRTGVWPDSQGKVIMSFSTEISHDGGNTWDDFVAFGTAGGPLPDDKFGNPQTSSTVRTPIVTPCQIRGVVTFVQPLITTITITVT